MPKKCRKWCIMTMESIKSAWNIDIIPIILKKSDIKMNVAIKLIKFNFENEGIFAFNAENDA